MAPRKAERKKTQILISIASQSGGGKTFSALRVASGMVDSGDAIGLLDTENGRGSMYVDSPTILQELPNSYLIDDLTAPFTPARYTEKIQAFEQAGCRICIIDSMTHEWEGQGGCQDIAENNKLGGLPNWQLAKREHKRMMQYIMASHMDFIFCLRAQEKTKIEENAKGKKTFVDMGIQPIQEKNFTFEMTLSLMLDVQSHRPIVTKCPEPLLHLFQREHAVLTPEIGKMLRIWNEGGSARTMKTEQELFDEAIGYANSGMQALREFFEDLPPQHKKLLAPRLDEVKSVAEMADERRAENQPEPTKL